MRQATMRWIAIALVAGLVATLAVGLVSGRGDPVATEERRGAGADPVPVGTESAALDGPHVVLVLCNGDACERPDESAEQQLQQQAEQDPRVASAWLVTSEQAYEFQIDQYGDNQDLVEDLSPEDVPAEIYVELHRLEDIEEVVAAFDGLDGVRAAHDLRALTNPS